MTLEDNLKDWYAVYPGSEKLDLGEKKPVAYFRIQKHAEEFAKLYKPFGYVEYMGDKEYVEVKIKETNNRLKMIDMYLRYSRKQ